MAYDEANGRVLLYGGIDLENRTTYDDLWAFDGTTWTRLEKSGPQPARVYAPIGYDRATRAMTLFGGFIPAGMPLDETWTWAGAWQQHLVSEPAAAVGGQVAFTAPDGAGVLFHGGGSKFDSSSTWTNETWRVRFENDAPIEICTLPMDNDGDGKVGCDDEDCAAACSACGDGICNAQENCRICPADCSCTAVCGDDFCDTGETQATCPGDCTP